MTEQNISVGKLGKPHGLSGAFRFLLNRELKSKKKFPKHFLLQQKGSFLPWFVTCVEWLGFQDGFILFEEISVIEKAKQFSGSELFLCEKDATLYFKPEAGEFDYLLGYKASDENAREIGVVNEIIENPGQILCSIVKGEKEIMIPFVEEFISNIDMRKKEIIFNLPEGLLDL